MSSVEFTAKIERGVIHLPKEFEDYEDKVARVTVTLETPQDDKAKKERLLAAFKKAQETGLFSGVEDPIKWQRELRDEWD